MLKSIAALLEFARRGLDAFFADPPSTIGTLAGNLLAWQKKDSQSKRQ